MKRLFFRIIGAVVLLASATYAGDYLSIRYRIPPSGNQFSAITIQPYYAIHEKNGRIEYDYARPETQTCVHSLFPHFGYSPCWYVIRHKDRRTDI